MQLPSVERLIIIFHAWWSVALRGVWYDVGAFTLQMWRNLNTILLKIYRWVLDWKNISHASGEYVFTAYTASIINILSWIRGQIHKCQIVNLPWRAYSGEGYVMSCRFCHQGIQSQYFLFFFGHFAWDQLTLSVTKGSQATLLPGSLRQQNTPS